MKPQCLLQTSMSEIQLSAPQRLRASDQQGFMLAGIERQSGCGGGFGKILMTRVEQRQRPHPMSRSIFRRRRRRFVQQRDPRVVFSRYGEGARLQYQQDRFAAEPQQSLIDTRVGGIKTPQAQLAEGQIVQNRQTIVT